ncbi:hypothetical protein HGRIS_005682 [Hohenbuehelia grisea]|uniref:HTH CENPB-type domain-containing protein n=1 Tax=Hohenbuehelia grisea TaxID=104357 RepID=A0ABR3JYG8_9AGAR
MDPQAHFQVPYDHNATNRLHPGQDQSWQANTTPVTSSLSTTTHSPPLFRNSDLEFSSPVPSSASPSYLQQLPKNPYPSQSSPSLNIDATLAPANMSTNMEQIQSSVGPDRVLTRSKRRAAAAAAAVTGTNRRFTMPPFQRPQQDQSPRMPDFNPPGLMTGSRPETPINGADAPQYAAEREQLSLQICGSLGTASGPARSHQYPLTPASTSTSASTSSSYPRYGVPHGHHSRSNSSTYSSNNSIHPRSASPALSTASSAPTSVSSISPPTSSINNFPALQQQLPSDEVFHQPLGRSKQRKQRLFNVDRKAICVFSQENPNARQEDIAIRYGVERSTISKILKNKQKWLSVTDQENVRVAKHRPSKFPDIEAQLVKWLEECKRNGTGLTDALIRNKAKEIARELNISEDKFKASSGWVENFKHRHGIRGGLWHADGKLAAAARTGTMPPDEVEAYGGSSAYPQSTLHASYDPRPSTSQAYGGHMSMPPPADPSHSHLANAHVPMHDGDVHQQPPVGPMSLHPAWPHSAELSPPCSQEMAPPPSIDRDDTHPINTPITVISVLSRPGDEPVPPPPPGVSYVVYREVPTAPPTTLGAPAAEDAIHTLLQFCVASNHEVVPPDEYDVLLRVRARLYRVVQNLPPDESEFHRTR